MDNLQDIISRLDSIESLLRESSKKDAIISELHADLMRQHTDLLSDLRRPVLQALLKVATRLIEIDRGTEEVVVLDNPAFENLASQVHAATDFVTDILSEDFDVQVIFPAAGDPYERDRHQSIEILATDAPENDRTIAEVVAPGFASLASGKIIRQATVKTFKLH